MILAPETVPGSVPRREAERETGSSPLRGRTSRTRGASPAALVRGPRLWQPWGEMMRVVERASETSVADAEDRFRLSAERLAVRLRWLSIAAIPALALVSPRTVAWAWFELLVATAVLYNVTVSRSLARGTRRPLLSVGTAVVDSLYLTALCMLSGGFDSPIAIYMYLAVMSVCMRLPLRRVLGVAALYACEITVLAIAEGRGVDGAVAVRVAYVFLTVAFVVPLVREARARFAEVLCGNRAQRQLLHRLLRSEEEERRRIAGELHDRGGGALFSMLHGLRRLRELVHPRDAAAAAEVDRLIGVTERTVHDLRALLADLRPRLLDDLGLAEALRDLLSRERALSGLPVSFDVESDEQPDPEVALALYRVAQEALTNIRRHAGARSATVRLGRDHVGWRLSIEDDGAGMSGRGQGLGLRTMRERVEALGGNLELAAAAGRGTRVSAWVPLARPGGTGNGDPGLSR